MGLIERWREEDVRGRVAWVALGALVVGGAVWAVVSFRGPPQIGSDEEVFKTVDALFTAVTARDERRLGECEARLRRHREAARLAEKPADFLDGVIAEARGGGWESAAERLYGFMLGQRRE